ncbi:MAG: geranylgeranyl pyrophosphate synthetase [Bathelium mastoideum]|nr:MAG: geranylgeranyl pyrophosphate synthetase [Bathelium mastoideum]
MHSTLLEDRAKDLVNKVTNGCDEYHGRGSMSPTVYDTAWISMISKPGSFSNQWLFPESFAYLLGQQCEDGSWISYASQIDGILNTAASLLALKKHAKDPQNQQYPGSNSLSERIERATSALGRLLQEWEVEATIHVGFEILVPALLSYLEDEGLRYEFPGKAQLYTINAKKLAKFSPEYLYMDVKLTALHSLEAFIGKLDFNRVQHHKVRGAFMASPSSTAAYLMNVSAWDNDCEAYLKSVVAKGPGRGTGGVPSAFPSTIFELTWVLSTLAEAGFALHKIAPTQTLEASNFLSKAFSDENGLVGFAPYVGADADDTAKTILTLNLLGSPISPNTLLQEFETKTHFKTYQQERDPSFSANCNVLNALLHVENPSDYIPQIEKTINFLCKTFQDSDNNVRDKWLWRAGSLPTISDKTITETLLPILTALSVKTIRSQNSDGSWGTKGFKEETAYAVLVLAYSLHLPLKQGFNSDVDTSVEKGRVFLRSKTTISREDLWVEKVTYASDVLSESYILAALNVPLLERRSDSPLSVTEPVSWQNGSVPEIHSGRSDNLESDGDKPLNHVTSDALPLEKANGANGSNGNHIEHASASLSTSDIDGESRTTVLNGTNGVTLQSDHVENISSGYPDEKANLSDFSVSSADDATQSTESTWLSQNERILLGPFDYLEQQPGKDMRTQFIQAFNTWLDVPLEKIRVITNIVKMLHTASLLIDDIEDSSVLRRGIPVAHSIFGVAQTLNSGNYIYFLALQEVQKLRQPAATNVFVTELLNLHRGQGMDLHWRDSLICPSEEEYLHMVLNKTGGLFRLAVKLMEVESPHNRDCSQLVDLMGQIFQIRDDYMNLFSTAYTQNKGLCEDLTEGKFSFPIIHSIRSDPENHQLMNILKQKSSEERIKRYAVSIMERTGSFKYTREVVQDLKIKASKLIERYEGEGWGSGEGARKMLARMDID